MEAQTAYTFLAEILCGEEHILVSTTVHPLVRREPALVESYTNDVAPAIFDFRVTRECVVKRVLIHP